MTMAEQFKERAEAYRRKARTATSAHDRRHYAAIAARCWELAKDADVVIGAALVSAEVSPIGSEGERSPSPADAHSG